jgi:hypothetical protein
VAFPREAVDDGGKGVTLTGRLILVHTHIPDGGLLAIIPAYVVNAETMPMDEHARSRPGGDEP